MVFLLRSVVWLVKWFVLLMSGLNDLVKLCVFGFVFGVVLRCYLLVMIVR